MRSNRNIFILVGAVVLLVGIYFFITSAKNHKWYETYEQKDENPYGCYALVELLKEKEGSFTVIKKPLSKTTLKKGNYLFIGSDHGIDSLESIKILNFVEEGNKAFIFTNSFPHYISEGLLPHGCSEELVERGYNYSNSINDSVVWMKLNPAFGDKSEKTLFDYFFYENLGLYSWSYLNDSSHCKTEKIEVLGALNDTLVNYYKIKHGKGEFFFHTNPIIFTNYNILKENRVRYVDQVLSNLSPGTIYWDEYNKKFNYNTPTPRTQSPLRFILSDISLKYGWYLSLALIVLYIIFYSKRRQRAIPVLEENHNSSIEYTETIGRLYFIQNNHQKLSVQKMKYFLGFVRQKYQMSTKTLDNYFIKSLSLKSGVPVTSVEIIFQQYKRIASMDSIAEDSLVNFHNALENFYKNCK